jgi:hypothetical protein
MNKARLLAEWVGDGKPVTPGGVLRPAHVPAAAATLGIIVNKKVRRASDVPGVYRPWVTAAATGLLAIRGSRALREAMRPDVPQAWFAALEAVLRAQVVDPNDADPRILCYVTLTTLDADSAPPGAALHETVEALMREREVWTLFSSFQNKRAPVHPVDTVLDILGDFGAVGGSRHVTPLGRWARHELESRIPPVVTPELPARELLAYLASLDEREDFWEIAYRWLREGEEEAAARELLLVAQDATPAERIAAFNTADHIGNIIGDEAASALWHEVSRLPGVGPHARAALSDLGEVPELGPEDTAWLTVEFALDSLTRSGTEEAWYAIQDALPEDIDIDGVVALIRASGHPGADELAEALAAAYGATGLRAPVYQLKISVRRLGAWRRVLVAADATLGELHQMIQEVLGWGTDHLHMFRVDGEHCYSDPYFELDMCGDEDSIRLSRALPGPKSKIEYVYDLGDDWRHDIVLEKVQDDDLGRAHPVCVGGAGANPVEDEDPDDPEEPAPFDQDAINRRLARMGTKAKPHATHAPDTANAADDGDNA